MSATIAIAVAAGCSEHPERPGAILDPVPVDEPEPDPAVEPAAMLDEPELDPNSACGRALLCCIAFAAATDNVVAASACLGPTEAHELADADARCERMNRGWSLALSHRADVEAPAACAE